MSSTSAAAATSQTGVARSMPSKRRSPDGTAASAMRGALGAEELDEARLDLLVPLLELLRVDLQQLQVLQPRLVGRVLHLGVAGVEALAVGQDLLDLAAENEVGEETGRVRMRREAGDRARRDHERHALL